MSAPVRVSIRQVAEHAGVSRMTVSNVMRGRGSIVAPETMERVLAAVRELEYVPVPQPTTQSRHVETRIIGLVFDCIELEDIWGLPTYRGMRQRARARGYDLLTMLRAPADWMLDSHELHFLDRRSDGIVFLVPKERARVLEALVQHRIPAVACFVDDVPPGVATITLDNAGAMKAATEYVIGRGHRKILHVAGSRDRADFRARSTSYEATMRAAHLEPCCTHTDSANWLAEVEDLLVRRAVSAIVCAADSYALPILRSVEKLELSVPRDISIISMDDLPEAAHYGLTTVRFSCEDVGQNAVESVTRLIAGDDYRDCSRVLPVEIVERTSVGTPP